MVSVAQPVVDTFHSVGDPRPRAQVTPRRAVIANEKR